MPTNTVLDIERIDVSYGPVRVLSKVSMCIGGSGLTAIIGPNGAGKSTVLKAVMHYIPAAAGRIRFNGTEITKWQTHDIIAAGLGYVPQGRVVFPHMTVDEHLALGAYTRRKDDRFLKAGRDRVYSLFPKLRERRKQLAGTMSGGEQQMLSIARALMPNPELVLLDEPSLGLAPVYVDTVFETLADLKHHGVAFLVVEQNAARILEVADHCYVLDMGENRLEGKGEELLASEDVRRLYLGLDI
jgi:branched-chain amino acid transport system ATP-binding protein